MENELLKEEMFVKRLAVAKNIYPDIDTSKMAEILYDACAMLSNAFDNLSQEQRAYRKLARNKKVILDILTVLIPASLNNSDRLMFEIIDLPKNIEQVKNFITHFDEFVANVNEEITRE